MNNTSLNKKNKVSLRKITESTLSSILKLSVAPEQQKLVATNAYSIAQAHFSKNAWFRAIYADETPVGFLMLEDRPKIPEYYIWRFMIDIKYQRLGFGKQALSLLIDHIKTRPNASEVLTSVVQKDGGPQRFYENAGFQLTGEYEEGEAMMKLDLLNEAL